MFMKSGDGREPAEVGSGSGDRGEFSAFCFLVEAAAEAEGLEAGKYEGLLCERLLKESNWGASVL